LAREFYELWNSTKGQVFRPFAHGKRLLKSINKDRAASAYQRSRRVRC
jgi:hypothetical protein